MTDLIDTFDKVNAMYIEGWERGQKWTDNANPYFGSFNYIMGREMTKEMLEMPNDFSAVGAKRYVTPSTENDIVKRIRGLR